MVEGIPPGCPTSADDNELSAGPPGAELSPAALHNPVVSTSSLVSAHNAVADSINQAEGIEALDVPSFAIPDAGIVDMMDAPQLDYLNPHYMGSPMWNLSFFFVSSPRPLKSLVTGDSDISQTFPCFVYDNSALGEYLSGVNEPDRANVLFPKCSRTRDGRNTTS